MDAVSPTVSRDFDHLMPRPWPSISVVFGAQFCVSKALYVPLDERVLKKVEREIISYGGN